MANPWLDSLTSADDGDGAVGCSSGYPSTRSAMHSLYTTSSCLAALYYVTAPLLLLVVAFRRLNPGAGSIWAIATLFFCHAATQASSTRRPSMQGRDGVLQSHLPNRAETRSTPFRPHSTHIRIKGVLLLRLAQAL